MCFRRSPLLLRRILGGFALRAPQFVHRKLNLLMSTGLLLQLLLQPLFGSQRLLLQSLFKLLLLLQRLLLLLPLLVHERLEHPFVALIAPPRGFRGGAPILVDAPLHLELLLHQLLLLLLLLLQYIN